MNSQITAQSLQDHDVVIVSAKRTPMGSFQGTLSSLKTPQLGSIAIKGAMEATTLKAQDIHEVIFGCVLPAGVGQAPTRQAALGGNLASSTVCTTVNKVCGSGMKAVMMAYDQIRLNQDRVMIAGGMESMSNSPYLLDRARSGYRLGHNKIVDHLLLDGLEDPYHSGRLMGNFAEDTATRFGFTREDQDHYAIESLKRAQEAIQSNHFAEEIIPIHLEEGKKNQISLHQDETPLKVKVEKIPHLKPAFHPEGTVTAANSSSLADGAAVLILMTAKQAQHHNLKPMAVIRGHASHAQEPEWFTTAPIGAIQTLLGNLQWSLNEVDLFEINEAFAVVTMATMKEMKIPHEKLNVWGGATTLGHPLGASGARILVTLLHALKQKNLTKGVAALCIGGGEATAMGIEVIS